jgi:hypothetical protein
MSRKYTLADYVKGRIPNEPLDKICKEADKLQLETIERAAKLIKKSGFDKTLKKLEEE